MTGQVLNDRNHYQVLGLANSASAADIKQAYRRLAKKYHPDVGAGQTTESDRAARMRAVNEAYAVLRHVESRRQYDRQMSGRGDRTARSAARAQAQYRQQRQETSLTDEALARDRWLKQVYAPLNRALSELLRSLSPQLRSLSADPFDDELIEAFSDYLDSSRLKFDKARSTFRKLPNPSSLAGVASRLYYVLNHLEDALDEMKFFPLNFDDRHLHTGQELFRLAKHMRQEAMEALQESLR
ncbi:MAG: DnaJ domain-containing protein [Cyanobacteria bacterium J06639_1]